MAEFDNEALGQAGMIPQGVELLNNVFPQIEEKEEPKKKVKFKPPNQSQEDYEIANMVMERKESSRNFRRPKQEIWDKLWDHYTQNYDSTGKEGWQSKRFWPETIKVVETICSNLSAAILGADVPVQWESKIKEFEGRVDDINEIVKNDVIKGKFHLNANQLLRELCLLGTAVGRVDYDKRVETVMVKNRKKPNMMEIFMSKLNGGNPKVDDYEFSEEEKVVSDTTKVKYVDLYKLFPEPYTSDISKDHWIIEERRISNAELMRLAAHPDEYYRIDISQEMLMSGERDERSNEETQARRDDLLQPDVALSYLDPDKPHTLDEYFGPAPIWMIEPGKKNDEKHKYDLAYCWFWVIDGMWVVRKKRNCYRDAEPPYFKFEYVKIPTDWWGIGPAEMMLWLQIEKNELVNTALDNVNIILNKVIAILKDKVPTNTWDRLKSEPGGMWLFENTDDIRKVMMPVEFGNLLKDIYMMIEMVDNAIQEVTGAVKATIGVGGAQEEAGGGTFRGQLMNKQIATDRFMLYARTLEGGGMLDCFRKFYQRIYQYKTYESVSKILGKEAFKDFEFIPPEELDEVSNLTPMGVLSLENRAVKPGMMLNFDKAFANEPWYKRYENARKIWVESGNGDPDTVTLTPDELEEFNRAKKEILASGQQGGPQPGGQQNEPPGGMEPPLPEIPPGPPQPNSPGPLPSVPGGMQ